LHLIFAVEMRRTLTLIGLAAAVALSAIATLAAPASAAQSPPVSDCNAHGRLTRTYTAKQLQTALSTMPADIKEYTDCYDVIQRALVADVGGHHVNGSKDSTSSGGSFLPTPVIVVIVVLALAAATFGGLALRRRSNDGGGSDGP
jgi:hypothetical protein